MKKHAAVACGRRETDRFVVKAFWVSLSCFLLVASIYVLAFSPAANSSAAAEEAGLLLELMRQKPQQFGEILAKPDTYEVQILFTEIRRDATGRPQFTSHSYGLDAQHYFYPASTVKLPVAALALQKIHQLDLPQAKRDCTLATGYSSNWEQAQATTTVAEYIEKIFYYSDNDAYHRLYNLLSVDYLNDTLQGMGYADTVIFRKFTPTNATQDGATPAVSLIHNGQTVYTQPATNIAAPYLLDDYALTGLLRGNTRKNFHNWNYFSLADMQLMLRALVLPESVEERYRFDIPEDDRRFLLDCMRGDGTTSYQYFIYGGAETPSEPHLQIYNKTGTAYGNILDNAYIMDEQNGVEFLLSAVIYVNPNGVIGDGIYAYESTGLPFLRDLGNLVYEYLLAEQEKNK